MQENIPTNTSQSADRARPAETPESIDSELILEGAQGIAHIHDLYRGTKLRVSFGGGKITEFNILAARRDGYSRKAILEDSNGRLWIVKGDTRDSRVSFKASAESKESIGAKTRLEGQKLEGPDVGDMRIDEKFKFKLQDGSSEDLTVRVRRGMRIFLEDQQGISWEAHYDNNRGMVDGAVVIGPGPMGGTPKEALEL